MKKRMTTEDIQDLWTYLKKDDVQTKELSKCKASTFMFTACLDTYWPAKTPCETCPYNK